jgi:predicted enzyme related to lactoylglutathione lyase
MNGKFPPTSASEAGPSSLNYVAHEEACVKKATKARAKAKKRPTTKSKVKKAARRPPAAEFDRVAFTLFQVRDSTRARAFYEDVLGLKRGLASPDGVWTEYDLPGGGCLALFRHPAGTFESSGGASLAFEVADLDGLNARLQAAGVTYRSEVIRGPHCRMSNILDSEGNGIILHQLDPR